MKNESDRRPFWLFMVLVVLTVVAVFAFKIRESTSSSTSTEQPDVYARVSLPNKVEYMREKSARLREVPPTIVIGAQAVIPERKPVHIVNETPVTQRFTNTTNQLAWGQECAVEFGGLVTVVEVASEHLFLEYTAPGNPVGSRCPSSVRFVVGKNDFLSMNDKYTKVRDAIQAQNRLVDRLLSQSQYGKPMEAAGDWHWVEVVNTDAIVQNFRNGYGYLAHGDSCVVGNGTVRARGEAGDKVLYEYTARGNPMGTPCPSGVLFFGEKRGKQ